MNSNTRVSGFVQIILVNAGWDGVESVRLGNFQLTSLEEYDRLHAFVFDHINVDDLFVVLSDGETCKLTCRQHATQFVLSVKNSMGFTDTPTVSSDIVEEEVWELVSERTGVIGDGNNQNHT